MLDRKAANLLYIFFDFISAQLAWIGFFVYRKYSESGHFQWNMLDDKQFFTGIFVIPIGWIVLYSIFDRYGDIYKRTRFSTISRTLILSFFGVLVIFFVLLLDDKVPTYKKYYSSFFTLYAIHFALTSFFRVIQVHLASLKLKSGEVFFNTLIIGGKLSAYEIVQELSTSAKYLGYKSLGFIALDTANDNKVAALIPNLGQLEDIQEIVEKYQISDIIIATEESEHHQVNQILNSLLAVEDRTDIKIIPGLYDIMLGNVKLSNVYGAVLIDIKHELMPIWQQLIKRIIDVVASMVVLIAFAPLYIFIAIRVKMSSDGPVFYSQERIGRFGRPFDIFKFRSMYIDSELNGPALSDFEDTRCTPWGLFMRKYRLDEIPQFWNVLLGDMSLVGPRPERQYFIDQILPRAPHFRHLLKVRPGITSWGQVKYGYASNVDQMIQRLKFDILYIENMSLSLDIKIIGYTFLVLMQGKGK